MMKQWPWYIESECDYFHVLRSKPELGRELEEYTFGDEIPGRPGLVRCYTVATCLSGRVQAIWGDGSESVIEGFCYGPARGDSDHFVIPDGKVYYKALTDDVDFVCIKPKGDFCLDQDVYSEPGHLPAKPDSWVVVLKGEVTIDGETYGQLEAVRHNGGSLEVNCTPDAVYIHVTRRGR